MAFDPVSDLSGRFGVSGMAVAILMIVFGVLVIVLPALLSWLVGILLIVLGVLWLVSTSGAMHRAPPSNRGPEPPRV